MIERHRTRTSGALLVILVFALAACGRAADQDPSAAQPRNVAATCVDAKGPNSTPSEIASARSVAPVTDPKTGQVTTYGELSNKYPVPLLGTDFAELASTDTSSV